MINAKVQHGIAIIPAEQKEIVVELKHPVDMERAFIAPGGSIIGAGISGELRLLGCSVCFSRQQASVNQKSLSFIVSR